MMISRAATSLLVLAATVSAAPLTPKEHTQPLVASMATIDCIKNPTDKFCVCIKGKGCNNQKFDIAARKHCFCTCGDEDSCSKPIPPQPEPTPEPAPLPDPTPPPSGWSVEHPNPAYLEWIKPPGGFPTITVPGCPEALEPCAVKHRQVKMMIGYLTVPLSYDPTRVANNVTTKVRVTMLLTGNTTDSEPLLFHCGGPGTDDTCVTRDFNSGGYFGKYHVFGISQRGIRSSPPSVNADYYRAVPNSPDGQTYITSCPPTHEDGTETKGAMAPFGGAAVPWPPEKGKKYTLRDLNDCSCVLPPADWFDKNELPEPFADPMDNDAFHAHFVFNQARVQRCYHHPFYQINKEVAKKSSSGETIMETHSFNYLDFVGTHELGKDLERFRQAIGAKKLSIEGFSYGTGVGATYAAMYPENVGQLLLNGNMAHGPSLDEFYADTAKGAAQVMEKLREICDADNLFFYDTNELILKVPGLPDGSVKFKSPCAVKGPGNAEIVFTELMAKVSAGGFSRTTWDGQQFILKPAMVYNFMSAHIRGSTSQESWRAAIGWLSALASEDKEVAGYATKHILDEICGDSGTDDGPMNNEATANPPQDPPTFFYGAPSHWYWLNTCDARGFPGGMNARNAVAAIDYINRFTADGAARLHNSLSQKYGPYELSAANEFGISTLGWPAKATPAVYGWRQSVNALIVGNLYDGATPMENTVWMRSAFPGSSLLTWQGVGHCVSSADYDPEGVKRCTRKMAHYMITGERPIDGDTCRQTQRIELDPSAKHRMQSIGD